MAKFVVAPRRLWSQISCTQPAALFFGAAGRVLVFGVEIVFCFKVETVTFWD